MISAALSLLTPEKANLMLLSPEHEGQCPLREKWFGTQYSVEGVFLSMCVCVFVCCHCNSSFPPCRHSVNTLSFFSLCGDIQPDVMKAASSGNASIYLCLFRWPTIVLEQHLNKIKKTKKTILFCWIKVFRSLS